MSETPTKLLERADLEAIFQRSPFIRFMNLEIREIDHSASRFSARMPLRDEYERRPGTQQFHGGAVAALIDVVGDFALGIMVGGGVPTMNLRVDYLRLAIGSYLDGKAVVRRTGRSSAVVDVEIFAPDGKLVALGRGTYVPVTG
jgi:uncharacterized protein (TIGR00369 family)